MNSPIAPRRGLLAAVPAAALLRSRTARAQAAPWPGRPIRVINPWTPGGPADLVARPIMERLSEALGQPVVIENRAGANGTIGMEAAARAAPDGYTLFFAHVGPVAISPATQARLPYDPVRDFVAVTQLVSAPTALVVHPDLPARDLAELMDLARRRPAGGGLTYGSVGPASTTHLAGEMLARMGGVSLVHVPYQGAAPVVVDLLGRRIDMAFLNVSGVLPHVQAGRLRGIGVSTPRRSGVLPDLPPISDTFPGFEVNSWYGVMVPAGTPPAVVDRLHRELVAAVRHPAVEALLRANGLDPEATSPAQFAAKIADDLRRWSDLARAINLRVEG